MPFWTNSMLLGGGGVQTSIAFLQAEATVITTASTYTFTAVNIGAADDNRIVVCEVYLRSNTAGITSATIGGVSATVLGSVGGTSVRMQIIYALVPTGTTANVVINTGATFGAISIGTHRLITATHTHVDTQTASGPSGTTSLAGLTGCVVGVWVVAHTSENNGVTLSSVTNGTIDVNTPTFNSNRVTACGRMTLPASAMTFTPSSASNIGARNVGWA